MTDTPSREANQASPPRLRIPAEYILASMTDKRGVITYANGCFTNISGYELAELAGAPHRLVRHPDMPRALFHFFWQRLKAGKPVGAYVKNKAKDGRPYSVFALAAPAPDGYLSVRIRPAGSHFRPVMDLYAQLIEAENQGATPDHTANQLLDGICSLGFSDYDDFMFKVFREELQHRTCDIGHALPEQLRVLDMLSEQISYTFQAAEELGRGFKNIQGEPANIRILSNRLEQGGSSISTIAQNYDLMAREMGTHIDLLCSQETGSLAMIRKAAAVGRFSLLASRLVNELAQDSCGSSDDIEEAEWIHRGHAKIQLHSKALEEKASDQLRSIVQLCSQIPDLSRRLRRRINGMDVVKLLCRVENCRIGSRDTGLNGVITRLDGFHKDADDILSKLSSNAIQTAQIARTLM